MWNRPETIAPWPAGRLSFTRNKWTVTKFIQKNAKKLHSIQAPKGILKVKDKGAGIIFVHWLYFCTLTVWRCLNLKRCLWILHQLKSAYRSMWCGGRISVAVATTERHLIQFLFKVTTTILYLHTECKIKSYIFKEVPKNRLQATCENLRG